jgi:CcmD family protein
VSTELCGAGFSLWGLVRAGSIKLQPTPRAEACATGSERMKNLNFLAAAYIAIWLIFCGYVFSVARRMAGLRDDIRRLKRNGK